MRAQNSATLLVFEQRGTIGWRWRFRDERGSFEAEVDFDINAPHSQILIERDSPLPSAIPGPRRRAELVRCLRALLGEREADAIASSPASSLHVTGARASHVALSLPYELLFRPEEPGRVIRFVSPPSARHAPQSDPEVAGRLFAAFALHADDPFLPLHAEGATLAAIAANAGIAYDELFLGFAAEDILSAGKGSSIIHLTGHGAGGMWRCHRRHGDEQSITSRELIDAWGERPPQLFVLNFCQSSSDDELLRLAEATTTGMVALHQYSSEIFSFDQVRPSSSMALDLTSALPTAALALRTAADDTDAREFIGAFYRAYLVDGLPLEEAFGRAVCERGFFDDAGLPVPCLYVSTAQPQSYRTLQLPARTSRLVRTLSPDQRRCLNGFYKAVGPAGVAMEQRRVCSITGEIGSSLPVLIESLHALTALRAAIIGADPPEQGVVEEIGRHHHLVKWMSLGEGDIACIGFDLECLPDRTAIGELLAHRRGIDFADLTLVAMATCNVPEAVHAVADGDVTDLAARLRAIADGRSRITDRSLQWELAKALISRLPAESRDAVRAWCDAKWVTLVSLGQLPVDIYAARFLLDEDAWLLERIAPSLAGMATRKDLEPEGVWAKVEEMLAAGVAHRGTSLLVPNCAPVLVLDSLTAARAWAACSEEAATAYLEVAIDRAASALGLDVDLTLARTEQLAWLASLSLAAGDPRVVALIAELCIRDDGAELAALLRAQVDSDLNRQIDEQIVARAPGPWDEWRLLQEAGLDSDAETLLEDLATDPQTVDHPLRIAVSRLACADLASREAAEQAADLESQLLAPVGERRLTDLELQLLLPLRQIRARAMHELGEYKGASEVLHAHYRTVVAQQAVSHVVLAGASAMTALSTAGALSTVREVWNAIAPMVWAMRPSADKVIGLAAEVDLLVHEGRTLRAREAAEQILNELAAWQSPRPGAVIQALRACAVGLTGRPESFVLLALLRTRTHEDSATETARRDRVVADLLGDLTLPETLAAASELVRRIPLDALGVTREGYFDAVSSYFEQLAELDSMTSGEVRIGEAALAGLTARAADGCRMSELILTSVRESGEPDALNVPADAVELERLASAYAPLAELLGHMVPDNFALSMPVVARAFRGDREQRTIWTGLLAGDIQRDLNPTVLPSLIALGSGEGDRAQSELRPTPENPVLLCTVCVTIEHCYRPKDGLAADAGSEDVVAFARSGWQLVLSGADEGRARARTALRALGYALAPAVELMEAFRAATKGAVSLRHVFDVGADETLTAEILDLLDAHPEMQLGMAEVALRDKSEEQTVEASLRVLQQHVASSHVPRRLVALETILWFQIAKPQAERTSESIAAGLDQMQSLLDDGAELTTRARINHLTTIAGAAFTTGQIEIARRAIHAALAHRADAMTPRERYDFHFNYVQATRILEGEAAGAEALAQAATDIGFLSACEIILQARIDPLDQSSLPFAEALGSFDFSLAADSGATALPEVGQGFLNIIDGAPGWGAVASVLRRGWKTDEG